MEFNQIIEVILSISPFLVAKILILIALLMYVLFAGIVLRQVDFMRHVLTEGRRSSFLRMAAVIHLMLVIIVFILSLLIL